MWSSRTYHKWHITFTSNIAQITRAFVLKATLDTPPLKLKQD